MQIIHFTNFPEYFPPKFMVGLSFISNMTTLEGLSPLQGCDASYLSLIDRKIHRMRFSVLLPIPSYGLPLHSDSL